MKAQITFNANYSANQIKAVIATHFGSVDIDEESDTFIFGYKNQRIEFSLYADRKNATVEWENDSQLEAITLLCARFECVLVLDARFGSKIIFQASDYFK